MIWSMLCLAKRAKKLCILSLARELTTHSLHAVKQANNNQAQAQ